LFFFLALLKPLLVFLVEVLLLDDIQQELLVNQLMPVVPFLVSSHQLQEMLVL